jgi:multicomponent Na+:H+ antiporter subunit E
MSEVKSGMIYVIVLAFVLVVIWLSWSGIYVDDAGGPATMMLSFGAISVAITVWVSTRLNIVDDEGQPIAWGIAPVGYFLWLLKEILIANIDVISRIIKPNMNYSPTWIKVSAKQKSRLGRAVFANSITLTPGTVSVDVGSDYIWVHAISKEGAESLLEGGDMGERVCKVEAK